MRHALLGIAVNAVLLATAGPGEADTYPHYGPPSAGPWSLVGHSVAAGSGAEPRDYPAAQPWDQPAGDYCSAYGFSQPDAPTRSAPLQTLGDVDLGGVTGFDPGVPREAYQLRHNAQPDSSACQARGATWGFWVNAATSDNWCLSWCGVRHDYATGGALGTRPWSSGYPATARLVLSASRHVRSYEGNIGWAYLCAMLQDVTTAQRLEYCLRVWRSWSGPAYDAPSVYYNPQIGAGFASVVTDVTATGTRFAQNHGGATTVVAQQPSSGAFSATITRAHLVNAVADANARIRSASLGTCLGLLSFVRCYSTDPDKYALLGVEDGLELLGNGTAHIGGHSTGLRALTEY